MKTLFWTAALATTFAAGCGGTPGDDAVAVDDASLVSAGMTPGHYVLTIHPSTEATELEQEVESILATPAVMTPTFAGIQTKVLWTSLEPTSRHYTFDALKRIVDRVGKANKKLFIQLQYITFDDTPVVPADLRGSGELVNAANGNHHARVWDPAVNARFIAMIQALHDSMTRDQLNVLSGLALPETACSGCEKDPSYSENSVVSGVNAELDALRRIFPARAAIQYINFLPGTANQTAALERIAAHACQIHAGLGVPDVRSHNGDRAYDPPGYPVLARYQGHIPMNLSVQAADYLWPEQLAPIGGSAKGGTYQQAVGEMNATFVNWLDFHPPVSAARNDGRAAFNIDDVYALATPLPTTNRTVDWKCP